MFAQAADREATAWTEPHIADRCTSLAAARGEVVERMQLLPGCLRWWGAVHRPSHHRQQLRSQASRNKGSPTAASHMAGCSAGLGRRAPCSWHPQPRPDTEHGAQIRAWSRVSTSPPQRFTPWLAAACAARRPCSPWDHDDQQRHFPRQAEASGLRSRVEGLGFRGEGCIFRIYGRSQGLTQCRPRLRAQPR